MTNPHALVVGGSGDIGRAVAVELAGLGLSVSLWGRDTERLAATAAACSAASSAAYVDDIDLADRAALPGAVAGMADRGALKVVVYAAGGGTVRRHFPQRGCPTQIRLHPQRADEPTE